MTTAQWRACPTSCFSARKHQLLMITVADLVRYRIESNDDHSLTTIDRLLARHQAHSALEEE
jgi:hypothetical protein